MLIGIIGCKRSGKNTVARIIQAIDIYKRHFEKLKLVDKNDFIHKCLSDKYFQELKDSNYHSKYEDHAFADNLKMCVSVITGIDYQKLFIEEYKDSDCNLDNVLNYRQLLQKLGTECCRNIDKDIWIKSLFKDYTEDSDWIVTDVRFENEANFLVKKGCLLFRINRDNVTNEHESETGLPNYPSIAEDIMNTGSMDDLIVRVENLMIKYKL